MLEFICTLKNLKSCLLILLFPLCIQSQNVDEIRKSDTIYVYFKRSKNQFSNTNNKVNINDLNYYYVFGNIGQYQLSMTFIHHYSTSPEEKKEKRSFLRKNKDLIITYDFLTKYNLAEATDLIGHKKKVYLIDDDDIGWFTIKLKDVKVMGTLPQSIE